MGVAGGDGRARAQRAGDGSSREASGHGRSDEPWRRFFAHLLLDRPRGVDGDAVHALAPAKEETRGMCREGQSAGRMTGQSRGFDRGRSTGIFCQDGRAGRVDAE